jgi:hypothetical protein
VVCLQEDPAGPKKRGRQGKGAALRAFKQKLSLSPKNHRKKKNSSKAEPPRPGEKEKLFPFSPVSRTAP